MARHLLFFGKFFRFPVLFLFFLCGADVIRKQSSADAFKKISFAPWTSRQSHVKELFLSAFESSDDFLGRSDEPERSRKVIRSTQRKNTQRNTAIDEAEGNLCNGPVTAGGKHQVGRLLESFFETRFFCGLVSGVMSSLGQGCHQLFFAMFRIASLWVVYQCDSHPLSQS